MISKDHIYKSRYIPEVDPNSRERRKVDGLYALKSKKRLEVLADKALKTRSEIKEALEKYKHALMDKQIEVLKEFYG